MKTYTYIFIIGVMALLASCSRSPIQAELDRAEALLPTDPDSAYDMLCGMDASALPEGSELEARYALLFTECQYKTYNDAPNDSLISLAADYYEEHGSEEEKFYAYLYQGIVRYLLNDFQSSAIALYRAVENSDAIEDHYSKGQMYMHLSALCADQYCYDDELYAQKAADEYKAGGLTDYYINALTKVAGTKVTIGEYKECHALLDSLLHLAYSINDTSAICQIISQTVNCDILEGSYEQAYAGVELLSQEFNYPIKNQLAGNFAIATANVADSEKAVEQLEASRLSLVSRKDTINYWANASFVYRKLQDKDALIVCLDTLLLYMEDLYSSEQKHTAFFVQKEYAKQNLTREKELSRRKSTIIFVLLVFISLILLLLYSVNRNKIANEKIQAEKIKRIQLISQYEKGKYTDALFSARADEFTAEIREKVSRERGLNDQDWEKLSIVFKTHLPHFANALSQIVHISDSEMHVCMLLKLGFTPKEIATLTCKTSAAISNLRKRLYKKAFNKEGKPSDWDSFIEQI